jgi:uncharacterized protein (DUF2062 family)
MTPEEQQLQRQRHERIARVKRVLRWMPRKSTMHRYPGLKWFRNAAIGRAYIWSFRVSSAVPALYAGTILAFLPLYGIQLPLAALAAFALRANLPILISLQFISNPLTVLPIYYTNYQIGRLALRLIGVESPLINIGEMRRLLNISDSAAIFENIQYVTKVFLVTSLGGAMIGTFLAAVAAVLYKMGAREVAVSYQRLLDLRAKRQQRSSSHPSPTDANPPTS